MINRFIQMGAIIGGAICILLMLMGQFNAAHSQGNTPPNPSSGIIYNITASNSTGPTDTVSQGEVLTYTVMMSITGNITSTSFISGTMSLSNTLPSGVTYVSGSVTGGGSYDGVSRSITHTVISPTGSISNVLTTTTFISITYAVTVEASPGTILHNSAVVSTADGYYETVSTLSVIDPSIRRNTLVLLYASLDNNLCSEKDELLDKLEESADNPDVTTLLLVDCDGYREDAFYYHVQHDTEVGESVAYELGKNKWRWSENLASPLSLYSFVTGAIKAYPGHDQVVLSLIGHGSGWGAGDLYAQDWTFSNPSGTHFPGQPRPMPGQAAVALLFDDSAQDALSVFELRVALEWITESIDDKLDLIYLDNCSMQMFEVAYQIRDYAEYLFGSPNTAWAAFPYDAHIAAIDGTADALTIARRWLNNEAKVLRRNPGHPFTLSIIDLSKMETLREKVDVLADELRSKLDANLVNTRTLIQNAVQDATLMPSTFESYYDGGIIDIRDHYGDLLAFSQRIIIQFNGDTNVKQAAEDVQAAIETAVVFKDYQSGRPWLNPSTFWNFGANNYSGLGIYLPFDLDHDEARRRDYNADNLASAQDGRWDELVAKFWENIEAPLYSQYCDEFGCLPGAPLPLRPEVRPPYLSNGSDPVSIYIDSDGANVGSMIGEIDFSNTCLSLNTVPTNLLLTGNTSYTDEILRFTVTSPPAYGELTQLDLNISACPSGTSIPLTVKSVSTQVDGTVLDEVTAVGYVQIPDEMACETIVDNADINGLVTISGTQWITSPVVSGFYGNNYLHNNNSRTGSVKYMAPNAGEYEVWARWTAGSNRAKNTPFDVVHIDGTETIIQNQQQNGGEWILLGTYTFGQGDYVEIRTDGTDGHVIADAMRFKCTHLDVELSDNFTGAPNTSVAFPVQLTSDVAGRGIYAFAFTITFDGTILVPQGVLSNGTMSENWNITVNNDVPGQIRVVGFSTTPLVGSGDLIHLNFDVVGDADSETDLIFSDFRFNEGDPSAQTNNGHFQVSSVLSGCVYYVENNQPVNDVDIITTNMTTTTGLDGCYHITPTVSSGIVTLSKENDIRGAIKVGDAVAIARYVAGLLSFDEYQLQACDVTDNGKCTALDAAEIDRYIVGLDPIEENTQVGQWVFDPSNRSYSQPDNNHIAFIMGDVIPDWRMPSLNAQRRAFGPDEIAVSIPFINTAPDRIITIPINVQNIIGKGIPGSEIFISYDPSVVTIDKITKGNNIPSGWSLTYNIMNDIGEARSLIRGIDVLESDGNLLNLSVIVKGESGTQTGLVIYHSIFNNGEYPVQTIDGSVQINYMNYMPFITK